MQLTPKHAAALLLLLCLLPGLSCSRPHDSAPDARAVLSSSPSPQNQNGRTEIVESPLPVPVPLRFVNDYANVIDGESEERLEAAMRELRDKSEVEFAVVTIETTGGRPIFDYSLAVARGWGLGPRDTSRGGGMLLMLATKDREWRLQVSRNLEKELPDELCKRLGEESRELYGEGKYAEGLTKYAGALVSKLEETRGFKMSGKLGEK